MELPEYLLKDEKATIMGKITPTIRAKLSEYIDGSSPRWKSVEVEKVFDFHASLQSRMKHPDFVLSWGMFGRIVKAGFMTIDEAVQGQNMTERELLFLRELEGGW